MAVPWEVLAIVPWMRSEGTVPAPVPGLLQRGPWGYILPGPGRQREEFQLVLGNCVLRMGAFSSGFLALDFLSPRETRV